MKYFIKIKIRQEPVCGQDVYATSYTFTDDDTVPLVNANGDFIQCGSTANQCGTNGFCSIKYGICCPKPSKNTDC